MRDQSDEVIDVVTLISIDDDQFSIIKDMVAEHRAEMKLSVLITYSYE